MEPEKLLDALDSVIWYNGQGDLVSRWKDISPDCNGYIFPPYEDIRSDRALETIWMIAVWLFGNYGTSPRSGWIEDIEGFRQFIDIVTKSYKEDNEW